MPTSRTAALYSPELLALAIELADFPFDPQARVTGEARSRSCGSTIALSSARPDRIERLGLRVSACAVGQASAALFRHYASCQLVALELTATPSGSAAGGRGGGQAARWRWSQGNTRVA